MAKQRGVKSKRPVDKGTSRERAGLTSKAGYFLSLSLENVRCFGLEQTLDLSDGDGKPARWTIILGVNGTGKTTILQSLVGFDLDESNKTSIKFHSQISQDQLASLSRNQESNCSIHIKYNEQDDLGSQYHIERTLAFIRMRTATIEQYINKHLKPKTKYNFIIGKANPHVDILSCTPPIQKGILPALPWCCAYGAGRRLGAATLSGPKPEGPTASLFSERAELLNPEEWLLRLDYAASRHAVSQARHRERYDQVKSLLLNILHEIEDIRLTEPSGTLPTPRVEFKTPYGWVPLRGLGYGYQTLISWVADLASRMVERYPDSPSPLAEPAVVLVDEIDLHLHPVWQRKLMTYLTELFPNTQFIATAHSPLVVQAAADANLAVLRREGDHVVIDNDVDNIRGWRVDQILTSDLFGLETARPPQFEKQMAERKALLTKPTLTPADKRRLKELETEIGDLPAGETANEVKELEQIRKTLELLTRKKKSS